MTKKEQLIKNRVSNPKKLSKKKNLEFIKKIHEISDSECQMCGAIGQDIHHPLYGAMGADRDTTIALLVCRACHDKCHKDKHGFNKVAEAIGRENKATFEN